MPFTIVVLRLLSQFTQRAPGTKGPYDKLTEEKIASTQFFV